MVKASHQMDLLGQRIVDFEERVNIPRLNPNPPKEGVGLAS